MTTKERYDRILAWFETNQPVVETELHYENPFQLLVAVVLSAQCTDKRVNMITPALFERYPTAEAMGQATEDEVFEYIRSVSYPNNKAKHLVGLAQMLATDFGGVVPDTMEEITKLPGVGRKTANVVLSVIYQQERIAVDTHVYRVSKRLGLVPQNANTPLKVEMKLMKGIPAEYLGRAHHWLILHGRYICTARKPKCGECPLAEWCRYHAKNEHATQA